MLLSLVGTHVTNGGHFEKSLNRHNAAMFGWDHYENWYNDEPFGHNRHRPKGGGAAMPLLWGVELCPHLTQCGQGLPPRQVSS